MVKTSVLLSGVTATQLITAALAHIKKTSPRISFVASGKTTNGAGSATVLVEATNDDPNTVADPAWVTISTLTLTLATTKGAGTQGSYATDSAYRAWRLRVTAISGTGAAVDGVAGN